MFCAKKLNKFLLLFECNLKTGKQFKNTALAEAKIRDLNSVSGEKLHDFEIICPASGLQTHPNGCRRSPTPAYRHVS